MKRLLPFLFVLIFSCAVLAQTSQTVTTQTSTAPASQTATASQPATPSSRPPQERMFFPKDWYWGWAEFDLAPPHNEIDPNLCAANAGQYGGVNAQCNAFARYMLSGTIEIRPFGRNVFRRLIVLLRSEFPVRQERSANALHVVVGWDRHGVRHGVLAVDLPKRFEFRFTAHPNMARFGSRDEPLGPAWLGPNGPWGQYNAIGVRKYFGTRREGTD